MVKQQAGQIVVCADRNKQTIKYLRTVKVSFQNLTCEGTNEGD